MSKDETESGSEAGSGERDQTTGDETLPLLADTDADLIACLLADFGGPDDADSASLDAHVRFGTTSDDMLVAQKEGKTVDELVTYGPESDGGALEPAGPNATPSLEMPQSVESGSMLTESHPIKIIFEDDGSASGSLI